MHRKPRSGWRRTFAGAPLGVWAALAGGVAVAALILAFATAPDNYTAQAVGSNIDLGNGEGAQLIGNVTLSPGDTYRGCITVDHADGLVAGYQARLYATGYLAGGAEDAINLRVEAVNASEYYPGGMFDCATVTEAFWNSATVFNGPLSTFAGFTDWDSGLTAYNGTRTQSYRFTVTIPEANAGLTSPGETASLGFVWQGRTP